MTDEENVQQPIGESAGSQLRRGREQKGLSVADVANAQHLRPAIIQSIENGDYQQIGSELFLKGYVRAYAKQVGLNADAIVATLDQELEPLRQQKAQALEASPLVDIERRKRQKRRAARVLMLLIAAGLAAFLAFSFLDLAGDSDPAPRTESMPEPEASDETESRPVDGAVRDQNDEAGVGVEPEPEPEREPPAETDAETAVDLVEEPAEPAPVAAGEDESEEIDESRIPVVTSSTEPALTEESRVGDSPVNGRLQVVFDDDCWIEVTDSSGARLVSSLQRQGDRIDVSGEAPLNVVIGAVDAVADIQFQGEPIELSDYRVVNNRTQFSLEI
ncbi:MAG: RodZ domain-containing protein [Pseudomonadota bacterium]